MLSWLICFRASLATVPAADPINQDIGSEMARAFDVPGVAEVVGKDLHEQRELFLSLSRSLEAMADSGIEPPSHWQHVHSALSDHFIALSQGR